MKKRIYVSLVSIVATFLFIASVAFAAPITPPNGGGTGIGSATSSNIGQCLKVLSVSPFTYTLSTCGSGGSATGTPNQVVFYGPTGSPTGNSFLTVSSTAQRLIFNNNTSIEDGHLLAGTIARVDWPSNNLVDSNGTTAVNWSADGRNLYDASASVSADWNNRLLYRANGFPSIDWNNNSLLENGVTSVYWEGRQLMDSSGNVSVDYGSRDLRDSGFQNAIDWNDATNIIFPFYTNSGNGGIPKFNGSGNLGFAVDGSDYWSSSTLSNVSQLNNDAGYSTSTAKGTVVTSTALASGRIALSTGVSSIGSNASLLYSTVTNNLTAPSGTFTNLFVSNLVSSTAVTTSQITNTGVKSALVLNGSGGLEGAYGGASACAGGGVSDGSISAVGATNCITTSTLFSNLKLGSNALTSTIPLTSINNDTTTAQKITSSGCITTSTIAGVTTIGSTCITGNQVITFTATGDESGTATGTTSISVPFVVTSSVLKAVTTTNSLFSTATTTNSETLNMTEVGAVPSDSGYKNWDFDPVDIQSGTAVATGTVNCVTIVNHTTSTFSTIGFTLSAPATGATTSYAGVYSGQNLVASTSISGVIGTGGYKMAVVATTTVSAGPMDICILQNGTGAMSISRGNTGNGALNGGSGTQTRFFTAGTATTSLSNVEPAKVAANTSWWMGFF